MNEKEFALYHEEFLNAQERGDLDGMYRIFMKSMTAIIPLQLRLGIYEGMAYPRKDGTGDPVMNYLALGKRFEQGIVERGMRFVKESINRK